MVERELSALSRICLARRISAVDDLDPEVQAVVTERNARAVKVDWQFSIAQARTKLERHYAKVYAKN